MTFTEAAIEVLRREGKPLHFSKIAEIAIRESLLDHVGKVPDDTMADQLAAHCRLPHSERRVMPVQHGTFGLVEWGLDEDLAGLENLIEPPPEMELPYRSRERHPIPSREVARATGRGEARGRRREREEEGRPPRFPPPAEVAYEILAGAGGALTLAEIAAQGAERLLMPDAFVRDASSLEAALGEDNRRREANGRRPLFQLEGPAVTLVAQPEPGERAAAVPAAPRQPTALTPADQRRTALAALRRRLRECDGPTVEHVAARLLEKLEYRELKVAKRGREHVVYTARRRLGVADVRHAIRIVRGGADAVKRDVADLRRDLVHYGAQIGVVVATGEAAREARGEAGAAGQLPIVLLCGEALAEAFAEAAIGCVPVVIPEVDEPFFMAAAQAAEEEEASRRVRREERDRREGREGREGRRRDERPAVQDEAGARMPDEPVGIPVQIVDAELPMVEDERPGDLEAPSVAVSALDDEDEDEGEEEGGEGDELAQGAASEGPAAETGAEPGTGVERKRRRRRRRRRGGRGRNREGADVAAAPASETAPKGPSAREAPVGEAPSTSMPGPSNGPPDGTPEA
jgi:hypothetical protein